MAYEVYLWLKDGGSNSLQGDINWTKDPVDNGAVKRVRC